MRAGNSTSTRFTGTGTALVTPFGERGIDYTAMGALIKRQIENGVDFLVVLGTTGEAPAISHEERRELIAFTVRAAGGHLPVVVGTGGNNTTAAIENCAEAQELGASGALVVTPYYNKPSQEGLFRHYEATAQETDLPIIAYNVPGRTGVNLRPATVERLAGIANIVGVKEASGDLGQVDEIVARTRNLRPDFRILSGNDDQTFHIINGGGHGTISVLSNVAPRETAQMVELALAGRVADARELHLRLAPLVRSLFIETNPMPVKYALSRMGFCENRQRLPLVEASEACMAQVDVDLTLCGLLDAGAEMHERMAV